MQISYFLAKVLKLKNANEGNKKHKAKNTEKFKKVLTGTRRRFTDFLKTKIRNYNKKSLVNEFRVIYYSDYSLGVARVRKEAGTTIIQSMLRIPVPANIITDGIVQNPDDLSQIILDMSIAQDIHKLPILLMLPSSFFKLSTFKTANLSSKSILDDSIKSKSPYLPADTIVQVDEISNKYKSISRVMYSQKRLISSWIKSLQIINSPIVSLTTSAPHILEGLADKHPKANIVLCDIEMSTITLNIVCKEGDFITRKLPYGSELYISNRIDDIREKFFIRLKQAIEKTLVSLTRLDKPEFIYLFGNGLDALIQSSADIPEDYKHLVDSGIETFKFSTTKELEDIRSSNSMMTCMAYLTSIALESK